MCCRRRERDHEIITTTMDGKKKYLKIDRLRKKPMANPLWKEITAIPCREPLSTISLGISCHPRKRTKKLEKGKNIRYANGRRPIKSLTFGCSLDYELSLSSVQSVARVQKNKNKK